VHDAKKPGVMSAKPNKTREPLLISRNLYLIERVKDTA